MRIARIVVDSAQLKAYYAALREGMEMAVRKEPGVLDLWAVAEKGHPTHITVFEIYADEDAYKTHVQTERDDIKELSRLAANTAKTFENTSKEFSRINQHQR